MRFVIRYHLRNGIIIPLQNKARSILEEDVEQTLNLATDITSWAS